MISKIIGAIWLGATVIGFNYGLYKIVIGTLIMREASVFEV